MSISDPDAKIAANKHLFLAQLGKVNEMDHVIVRGKTKPFALQTRSKRGSRYRGVSKNGSKWQVMVVRGEIKKYVGAIDNEEVAACIYDKHALILQGFAVSVTNLARLFHFRGCLFVRAATICEKRDQILAIDGRFIIISCNQ